MKEELEELREKLSKITIIEKPNTFLDVINKTRDEVLTSSWIAFVLNPERMNLAIIEQILEKTKRSNEETDFTELIKSKDNLFISVDTEKWISDRSRIDIIIKFSKFWIVIENKVDSNENGDQSLRYEEDLKNVRVPIKYICLKPENNKCVLENKKFVNLTYSELAEILKRFTRVDLKKSEDFIYLNELIKHMEVHLMESNEIKINEKIQFYIENKPKMDEIVNEYNEQCKKVREKLLERIKEKIKNEDSYRVSEKFTNYLQLWKTNWPAGLHYEIGYHLNDIIGKNNEITYRIDNETGSYQNISKIEVVYKKQYDFDNIENIEESIEEIATKLLEIAEENNEEIEEKLSSQVQYTQRKTQIMSKLEEKIRKQYKEEDSYYTYLATNKNIEYIQVWKEGWDNTEHMGLHYEILCDMKELSDSKIKVTLAIHNEGKTRKKYQNIHSQNIDVKEYWIDTDESIEELIESILIDFNKIVENNNVQIEKRIQERG